MAIRVPSRTKQRRYGFVRVPPVVVPPEPEPEPPVCPVLSSPLNGSTLETQTTATLQWEAVAGADTYNVYIWITAGVEPDQPTANVAVLTYEASDLIAETGYSWKITAVSDGLESEGCGARTFSTAAEEVVYGCQLNVDNYRNNGATYNAGTFVWGGNVNDTTFWNSTSATQTWIRELGALEDLGGTCSESSSLYSANETLEVIAGSGSTFTFDVNDPAPVAYTANNYRPYIAMFIGFFNAAGASRTITVNARVNGVTSASVNLTVPVNGGLSGIRAAMVVFRLDEGAVFPIVESVEEISAQVV